MADEGEKNKAKPSHKVQCLQDQSPSYGCSIARQRRILQALWNHSVKVLWRRWGQSCTNSLHGLMMFNDCLMLILHHWNPLELEAARPSNSLVANKALVSYSKVQVADPAPKTRRVFRGKRPALPCQVRALPRPKSQVKSWVLGHLDFFSNKPCVNCWSLRQLELVQPALR